MIIKLVKSFRRVGKNNLNSKTFIFNVVVECLDDITAGRHVCTLDQQERSITLPYGNLGTN